jgi:predicted cupin superfamily sugar epimerase
MGTTMAPGFDFADFQAGDRAELTAAYPAFAEMIGRLTAG